MQTNTVLVWKSYEKKKQAEAESVYQQWLNTSKYEKNVNIQIQEAKCHLWY